MCRVSYFCCGCSLTAGAITAAVLQGISTLLLLIGAVQLFMVATFFRIDDPDEALNSSVAGMMKGFATMNNQQASRETDANFKKGWIENRDKRLEFAKYFEIGGGVFMAITIISLIICLFLVVAIVRKSAKCVLPWLIGNMIKIVLYGILCLPIMILGLFVFAPLPLGALAIDIYFWIVLLNYYRELKSPGYQPAVVYKA